MGSMLVGKAVTARKPACFGCAGDGCGVCLLWGAWRVHATAGSIGSFLFAAQPAVSRQGTRGGGKGFFGGRTRTLNGIGNWKKAGRPCVFARLAPVGAARGGQ